MFLCLLILCSMTMLMFLLEINFIINLNLRKLQDFKNFNSIVNHYTIDEYVF